MELRKFLQFVFWEVFNRAVASNFFFESYHCFFCETPLSYHNVKSKSPAMNLDYLPFGIVTVAGKEFFIYFKELPGNIRKKNFKIILKFAESLPDKFSKNLTCIG